MFNDKTTRNQRLGKTDTFTALNAIVALIVFASIIVIWSQIKSLGM